MTLNFRDFKLLKTAKYIKKTNFFFFAFGVNRFSNDWIIVEQELKKLNLKYYKVFNKSANKVFNRSIFLFSKNILGSTLFFLSTEKHYGTTNKNLKKKLSSSFFDIACIKLNTKIYTSNSVVNNYYTLNYKENKLIFYKVFSSGIEPFVII